MTLAAVMPRVRWSRVFTLVGRELRDQFRDWRVVIPVVILTGIFPLLMNYAAQTAMDFVSRYGAPIIAEQLFPFMLMIVGFFPTTVSLVIALESFVGEKERFSLEPLLSTPLSDAELFLGKALASTATPLASAALGILVYLTGLYLAVGWLPSAALMLQIIVLTLAHAVGMVSAAVVISAQTNSVRAANLLASFIIIPAALLVQAESLLMFWRRYDALWWVILGIGLLAFLFVRIGLRQFQREELLEREVEELRLDRLRRNVWLALTAGARNPIEWYRQGVFPAARRAMSAGPWVAAALIMGAIIGLVMASRLPLRLDLGTIDPGGAALLSGLRDQGLLSPSGAMYIFFHNLRTVVLASLLGVFSLGVLSLIVLMAPLGIIAYAAALVGQVGGMPWLFIGGFVVPHAVIEIPALWLAGCSMLRWGSCLLARPDGRTIGGLWLESMGDWVRVTVGLVLPLLLAAAWVESYLTPYAAAWALAAGAW
ncbi:MAG: hypothetical protein A2Z30_00670 [Chloroflexi bacterium RBG_16_64_43]|nr:MAG: hypothetical protein A2Z30_00670 [Chloroflexi bacterium RBG_16_64_43]